MKKRKKSIRIIFRSILTVLAVIIGFSVLLITSPWVQTKVAKILLAHYAKELKTQAHFNELSISILSKTVMIRGLYVEDLHGQVLLSARKLEVSLDKLTPHKISFKDVLLDKAICRLVTYKGEENLNLQFIVDYFASSDTTSASPSPQLLFERIKLNQVSFLLQNQNRMDLHATDYVDYNNMDISHINLLIEHGAVIDQVIRANIKSLSCEERSGFKLKKFSSIAMYSNDSIMADQTTIITPNSQIRFQASIAFDDFSLFSERINELKGHIDMPSSHVDMKDIAYFAHELKSMNTIADISLKADGALGDLMVDHFLIQTGDSTLLKGKAYIKGLPYVDENTFADLDIQNFRVSMQDLNHFDLPNEQKIILPDLLTNMGVVHLSGKTKGSLHQATADLNISSDYGHIKTALQLTSEKGFAHPTYNGTIQGNDFALAHLLQSAALPSSLNFDFTVAGSEIDPALMIMDLSGNMTDIVYHDNVIDLLSMEGRLENQKISAALNIDDTLINLSLQTDVGFNPEEEYLKVDLNLNHINLTRLNVLKDSADIFCRMNLQADLHSLDFRQPKGSINLSDVVLLTPSQSYKMNHFDVVMDAFHSGEKHVQIQSDYLLFNLSGQFEYAGLSDIWKHIEYDYLPTALKQTTSDERSEVRPEMDINFSIDILQSSGLIDYFAKGLNVSLGTHIEGDYLSDRQTASLTVNGKSKRLAWLKQSIDNLVFSIKTSGKELSMDVSGDQINLNDSINLRKVDCYVDMSKELIDWGLRWDSIKHYSCRATLGGTLDFLNKETFKLAFNQFDLSIFQKPWYLDPENSILFSPQGVDFQHVNLFTKEKKVQKLSLSGLLNENPEQIFHVNLENFDLKTIEILTKKSGMDITGLINGDVRLADASNFFQSVVDVHIDSLNINNHLFGILNLKSEFDEAQKGLAITAAINQTGHQTNDDMLLKGFYYPENKHKNFDISLILNNLDIAFLKNYVESFSSNLTGTLSGNLTLDGTLQKPLLKGSIKPENTFVKVDFLNTTYEVNQANIEISLDKILFRNMNLIDTLHKTKAILNGSIVHRYFNDIKLDFNLTTPNLLVMNTKAADNETFFGTAFISGDIKIKGPVENILIDVNAKTEHGTVVTIPMEDQINISDNKFITFVDHSYWDIERRLTKSLANTIASSQGLHVVLNLDVNQNASIFMNMQIGPQMQGNIMAIGNGNIRMDIPASGDFKMFGDYVLEDGSFDFIITNIANRKFSIQKGSSLSWSGAPENALINLSAVYNTKASLYPILSSMPDMFSDSELRKKYNVQSIIHLKNNLMNPDLSFDIELAGTTQEMANTFNTLINPANESEIIKQSLSLIVFNSFTEVSGATASDNASAGGDVLFGMLTTQLNNLISKVQNLNIGVNYEAGDGINSGQFGVSLGMQFFDDRLSIDGNVGVMGNTPSSETDMESANASNFSGDVTVEWKQTEKLRFKAFHSSNETNLFKTESPYTEGVGVMYRLEGNRFFDMFRHQKPKKKKQPKTDPAIINHEKEEEKLK